MKNRKVISIIFQVFGYLIYGIVALWCFGAVWYSNLPWEWLRITAALIFAALTIFLAILAQKRPKTAIPCALALLIGVYVWWELIPASNEGDWMVSYSRMPYAAIHKNEMVIHNIRDFQYRTPEDFTVKYITEAYNINDLRTVDLAYSYWDGNKAVAHTMLSFGFSDGRHLVISSETRMKKGQKQNAIKGLYKQYQTMFILGTEDDLFKLRSNYRKEKLYVYPTSLTPEDVRILFLDLISQVNRYHEKPEFYNTIVFNCTTSLIPSIRKVRPARKFDIRLCLNGYSDRLAFEGGGIKHRPGISFEDYKKAHQVDQYLKDFKPGDNYSQAIRPEGIF